MTCVLECMDHQQTKVQQKGSHPRGSTPIDLLLFSPSLFRASPPSRFNSIPFDKLTRCGRTGRLVFQGDVAEQVRHGFFVVDAPNGLGQQHTDVDRLDFVALHLLDLVWDRVRHHNLPAPSK